MLVQENEKLLKFILHVLEKKSIEDPTPGYIEEEEELYEAIPADMDEAPEPPPQVPRHRQLSRAVSLM